MGAQRRASGSGSGTRLGPGLAIAVHVASLGWFLSASPHSRWDFPLDDAWIHQVYARALAAGQGLAYNEGQQEAGTTSPLWTLVTAPAHWLPAGAEGGGPVLGVKVIGALAAVAAVWLLWRLAHRLTASAVAATLAASLLASEPRLAFAALSGMETPLLVALWLAALDAALEERPGLAASALGLTPLVRPEAGVLLPFGVAIGALGGPAGRRAWLRPGVWAALLAPSLAWSGACRANSGSWDPNSFHEKASAQELSPEVLVTAWRALTQHGWAAAWPFALVLGVWCVRRVRDGRGARGLAALGLVAAPLAYLLAVTASRPVELHGYYWTRWGDPASLWLCAAFGVAVGGLAVRGPGRAGAATAALLLLVCAPAWLATGLERRARLASDGRAIRLLNVAAGRWIDANLPAQAVVGVNDAGALRYFGRRRTVDLVGLNYGDLLHGRVPPPEVFAGLDALAVFPALFPAELRRGFEERRSFRIPPREYTICDCPQQSVIWIGERAPAARPHAGPASHSAPAALTSR